jgi:hypothetical protein
MDAYSLQHFPDEKFVVLVTATTGQVGGCACWLGSTMVEAAGSSCTVAAASAAAAAAAAAEVQHNCHQLHA